MVRALPDICGGGRELRPPMSPASRRTHMLSRRQASLLSSGIAYCELCCVLIAPGIQRSSRCLHKAARTPDSGPGVQPVRHASVSELSACSYHWARQMSFLEARRSSRIRYCGSIVCHEDIRHSFFAQAAFIRCSTFFLTDNGPGVLVKPEPMIDKQHRGQII